MTDAIAVPDTAAAPAAQPPALTATEIEALLDRKVQELSDKRIAGYQQTYDKKLSALEKELQVVRRATLSEGEIEQEQNSDIAQKLADAERRAAIAEAAVKFPSIFPAYQRLISAATGEDQMAVLAELLAPKPPADAAPPAAPAAPAVPPTPVDPNNPTSTSEPTTMIKAQGEDVPMNASIAARILGLGR